MRIKTLLVFVFFVFMTVANSSTVKNIAHRGCSSLAPENTYSAWEKAIETGADYFELDIQLSSDDSLVIMHDNTVDRTTDGTGDISTLTYAQLMTLDAGSWFSNEFVGEKIPTFSQALELALTNGNIDVVAEIKSTALNIVPKVVAMIQAYNMQSRVIVSSFTQSQLTICKSLDPSIDVQLFGTINNSLIDQVAAINGEWVGSGGTITQALIDYAHSKNILFNAWTINTGSQMLALIAIGIDAITTNFPQTLVAVTDTTAPTDVLINSALPIGETDVTLNWQAATDPESDIIGYEIYRDINPNPTVLYTTVGDTTDYVDHTLTETQIFYYRIKAINGAGIKSLNYSNEVSATTSSDVTKPVVSYVTSEGDTSTIYVEFSERVDETTSETLANYTINKGVVVLGAELLLDQKTVKLSTTHMLDTSYTITVKNVKDRAIVPNTMVTAPTIFLHTNSSADVVAYYQLDNTNAVGADTLVIDASVNLNNGTSKNGPVIGNGYLGNAMEFDGVDDYVQFTASSSFDNVGSAVTVSVWTKLAYLPSQLIHPFGPLFDSESDQYVLYEDRGNNELRFKVTTNVKAERPGIPASALVTGQCIHVVGVYDGANAKIYLNGVLRDTHPITGTVNTGQVAMLGKSGTSGSPSYFKGSIDNVLVLNKALSETEVMELYTKTKSTGVDPRPSDVVLNPSTVDETAVNLSWNPASTYESVIMGYEIYRDITANPTTLIATVDRNQTNYVDNTDTENQTFYYRVKAKNSAALLSANFSNEVTALTSTDTKVPKAVYVTSQEANTKIVIEFSELVDELTAEDVNNYSVSNGIVVTKADLCLDGKTVILQTSPMSVGAYQLMITNVKDKAAVPNSVVYGSYYQINHSGFPSGLIAFYSMDDTRVDTLFDDYINANNGVFTNGPSVVVGNSGNALGFDGVDDFVQFSPSVSFDSPTTAVSVSSWVKLDYLPTEMTQAFGPIFDSQGDQYVLYVDRGNKELRFKATTSGGAARSGIPQVDLITGKWIHVAGVYDGANAMIYLNGVRKGILPLTGNIVAGQIAMLGKSGTSGTPAYLKGKIDQVAVFGKALSESEVADLYNNYKVPADYIIPVELTSFTAASSKNKVSLIWETATETNNYGYEVQKSSDKLNFTAIGFVPGAGTSTEKHSYSFSDDHTSGTKAYYRLKQINLDGTFWYSQVVEAVGVLPVEFGITQNYPNPFNPVTTIEYQLPVAAKVSIKLYDMLGSEIVTLVNETKDAGFYKYQFNGSSLASGTYFFRIQANDFVQTKKMTLLK
ncbi:MAG: T9SS type A sorting domain-containing protein [Ignavibacteriaceae bacterium]|nr:T9SS type A sorting domain-containing protein [Ignavibacteriaceae bacterium]